MHIRRYLTAPLGRNLMVPLIDRPYEGNIRPPSSSPIWPGIHLRRTNNFIPTTRTKDRRAMTKSMVDSEQEKIPSVPRLSRFLRTHDHRRACSLGVLLRPWSRLGHVRRAETVDYQVSYSVREVRLVVREYLECQRCRSTQNETRSGFSQQLQTCRRQFP